MSDLTFHRTVRVSLVCAVLVTTGATTLAQEPHKHLVTFGDLQTVRQAPEAMQLSPDGRWLVYSQGGALWLVSTLSRDAPRRLANGILGVWSPNNKRIAYYSSEAKNRELWVFDLASRHSRQITNFPGGIDPDPLTRRNGWSYDAYSFSWSPDSTRLVFASRVGTASRGPRGGRYHRGLPARTPAGTPVIVTRDTRADCTVSGLFASWEPDGCAGGSANEGAPDRRPLSSTRVSQLFTVQVDSGVVDQLTRDQTGCFNPDWSPDGQRIACASDDGRSLPFYDPVPTNIYVLDIASGSRTAVTAGANDKRLPRWSPDGSRIAYLGGEHFGTQQVFVVPSSGHESRSVTIGLNRSVVAFDWVGDGRSVIVSYIDGTAWPIARVDSTNGEVDRTAGGGPVFGFPVAISRSGAVAWAQSDPLHYGTIHFKLPGDGESHVLVNLNPQISAWQLGSQALVHWKTSRGDEKEGILLLPPGHESGHRYPLIVDLYPTTLNTFMGFALSGNQAWASQGYAVFWPNARAPHVWANPFWTAEYDQAAKGPNGWDVTVDDVMSGVDALIARGIVDQERMGLYGWSNGAAVVSYLVTRTTRFRCAVSLSGWSDWLSSALIYTDSGVPFLAGGATPWDHPEALIQLSAVFHVSSVTTPMLLASGDRDVGGRLSSLEMYNGLRHFGLDVTLLRYPDQGHELEGRALKDFWDREALFFAKCLNTRI